MLCGPRAAFFQILINFIFVAVLAHTEDKGSESAQVTIQRIPDALHLGVVVFVRDLAPLVPHVESVLHTRVFGFLATLVFKKNADLQPSIQFSLILINPHSPSP